MMLKQNKLTQMHSSYSTTLRAVIALIAVTTTVARPAAQPTSVEALGSKPWPSDEWPAEVVPIAVAPVPTVAFPMRWFSDITERGRGTSHSVTSTKRPPTRFTDFRGRKHGRGRKRGNHGGCRKRMKHGRGRSKGPRPNKGQELFLDSKLVFVNVEAGRTLNSMPISSPPPVLTTKVLETVARYGGAATIGDQLLYSIVSANAIWSVVVISWAIAIVIIYRGWCNSVRTSRLGGVPMAATESQLVNPTIAEFKSITELKSANTLGPMIDLEPAFELKP